MTENPFRRQEIESHQTVGEILKATREHYQLTIADVAQKTKISVAYLTALENGRYHDLPSPVYIRNYLQSYAKVLKLPWPELDAQYQKEIVVYRNTPTAQHEQQSQMLRAARRGAKHATAKKIQAPETVGHRPALLVPQLLKYGVAAVVVMIVALYIVVQVVRIYNPPSLVVTSPATDVQAEKNPIHVKGNTDPESVVEINGQQTHLNEDGSFDEEIYLQEGLNELRITTRSARSRKREVTRYVLFAPEKEEESTEIAQ